MLKLLISKRIKFVFFFHLKIFGSLSQLKFLWGKCISKEEPTLVWMRLVRPLNTLLDTCSLPHIKRYFCFFRRMEQEVSLPLYFQGKVDVGFGRGGKQLGCPTGTAVSNVALYFNKMSESRLYFNKMSESRCHAYLHLLPPSLFYPFSFHSLFQILLNPFPFNWMKFVLLSSEYGNLELSYRRFIRCFEWRLLWVGTGD